MIKSRSIFVDLHAGIDEHVVVRSRNAVCELLIGNSRSHYPYVDASLCSYLKSSSDLVRQNEIRRHDPAVFLRVVDHVEIYVLTDRFVIQRAVAVRNAITRCALHRLQLNGFKRHHVIFFMLQIGKVPHLNKHRGKALDSRSFKPYAVVFPVTERIYDVEVFICDVVSAGIAHLAVDDRDLSVVAVVHEKRKQRIRGIKRIALDAFRLQYPYEIMVDENG